MRNALLSLVLLVCISVHAQIFFPDPIFKAKLLQSASGVTIAMNSAGVYFKIDQNGDEEIDQSEALAVEKLFVDNANISSISGIENFINLKTFSCYNNLITTVNLSALNLLTTLQIFSNNLTSIDLTGLTSLKWLSIGLNPISSVDLSGLPNLADFRANNCQLTSLDVSHNLELQLLRVDYNQITSLDLSNNLVLSILYCNNNQLTDLNVSANGGLNRVLCQNNQITSLDFSNNHYFSHLSCSNNNLTSININNNVVQDVSNSVNSFNDCWKQGNPNLTTICADASEVASVQSFLDGCGSASQVVTVTSACGLANESFAKDSFTISPNPTKDTININYNGDIKMVALYDSQGRILLTKRSDENLTTIDVSGYANGVYFIEISTDNGIKMEKFIKE